MTRLGSFLTRTDPLADDVLAELGGQPRARQEALITTLLSDDPSGLSSPLRRLHESLREVPFWFDPPRADAGGEVVLRGGLLSGFVLGFKSLVLGYCSPAGNKPLAMSGRLEDDVARRLSETGRFVEAICSPGGMAWGGEGLGAAVRVRLIHARVRQALDRSPAWNADAWGAPINQYDLAGTLLLFSSVLLDGLQAIGFSTTREEREALMHLWRYVGRVMGVDEELVSTSHEEATALWALLEQTQAAPDLDSRKLSHALILDGVNRGVARPSSAGFGYALSRHLIGPRYADALAYPRSLWDLAPPMLVALVSRLDRLSRRFPGGRRQALRTGIAYWRHMVELSFRDRPVEFAIPERPLRAS